MKRPGQLHVSHSPVEETGQRPNGENSFPMGVRSFLFLILAASSVLPVSYFGWAQAEHLATLEVTASDRQATAAAQAAAGQLHQAMQNYVWAAESLSAHLARPGSLEPDAVYSALDAHVMHQPELLGAYVADASGVSRAHLGNTGDFSDVPIGYADRDYFRELKKTHRTAISKVGMGRFTRVLSVQVAAPIHNADGSLGGFTCSSVDLSVVTERAKSTASGMAGGRVLVIDGDNMLIADSERELGTQPKSVANTDLYKSVLPGRTELRSGPDERMLSVRGAVVGLPSPVAGWRVVATTPLHQIELQARRMKQYALGLASILIVVTLAISAWLSAIITRPLRQLAASADAITRGELRLISPTNRRVPREMARLSVAMRSMVDRLRDHAQHLEAQVLARTQELQTTNGELEEALGTIEETTRIIRSDIAKASQFQAKMLPSIQQYAHFDVAAHYKPLQEVSGDIYDVYELEPDRIRVFLADVTGHGVQASMRTLLLKSAYDRLKALHASPNSLLLALNNYLVDEFPNDDFHCTACCIDAYLTRDGVHVAYSNAGGPPLFLLNPGAPASEVYAEGPMLGVSETAFDEPTIWRLEQNQQLVIASDGFTEQWDASKTRFDSVLLRYCHTKNVDASTTLSALLTQFDTFRADVSPLDDITVLVLRPR